MFQSTHSCQARIAPMRLFIALVLVGTLLSVVIAKPLAKIADGSCPAPGKCRTHVVLTEAEEFGGAPVDPDQMAGGWRPAK